jgi:outer membrane protein OmpA-like peptidoglycan-associated protein
MKILTTGLVLLMVGCTGNEPKPVAVDNDPMPKKVAYLTESLLAQVAQSKGVMDAMQMQADLTVINPFIDVVSGQVIATSLDVEAVMLAMSAVPCAERDTAASSTTKKDVILCRLDEESFEDADYIINGGISHEKDPQRGELRYRITASVIDIDSMEVVASERVWLNEQDLDYTPVFSYADSPIYGINKVHQELLEIIQAPVERAFDDSIELLEIESVIADANTAYQDKDYETARAIFARAAEYPAGKGNLKIYGGLYAANVRLGDLEGAEKAFVKVIEVGTTDNQIPLRIMFEPASTDFLREPKDLGVQYAMWLRQIGSYLAENDDVCLKVVGHSSKPGNPERNLELSRSRAEEVMMKIVNVDASVAPRIKVEAMGSAHARVDAERDSPQTAIDRRVEMKKVDCE